MIWNGPICLLAARNQDDDLYRLIGIGVLILLSVIGSIVGKIRGKAQPPDQEEKKRRRPVGRGPQPEEEPVGPEAIRPVPGPPRRRPPIRAVPPRATPLPRDVGPAGQPLRTSPGQVPRGLPRVGSVGQPSVADRRPIRPLPPRTEPLRAEPPRPPPSTVRLGERAARAAEEIAEHAAKAVAEHAQMTASQLAREERLHRARLAKETSAGPPAGEPADVGSAVLIHAPLTRDDLRRAVVLTELLAPPLGERGPIQ